MRFSQVIELTNIELRIQMGSFHGVTAIQFKKNWILINTGKGGTNLISASPGLKRNDIKVVGGFGEAETPQSPYKKTPSEATKAVLRSMLEDGATYKTTHLDHISLNDVRDVEITTSHLIVTVDPGISFFWKVFIDKESFGAREGHKG